jgi:SH3-like domain-containing protein
MLLRFFMSLAFFLIPMGMFFQTAHAEGRFPEPVCVSSAKARLRAAPSTNSKVTWNVGRYMPLERLSEQNGWSRVRDLRGQTHWVISSNITTNATCAVVKVRVATLVKGSGGSGGPADFQVADRYTPYKRIEREGDWVRLEDDFNGTYWTKVSNLWMPMKRTRLAF